MVATQGKKGGSLSAQGKTVLDYLRKVNRPYSAGDVTANLHNALSKGAVQKALAELTEHEHVMEKTYGKQSVFCFRQDQLEAPGPKEASNLTKASNALASTQKQLTAKVRTLQAEVDRLSNVQTLESVNEDIERILRQNDEITKQLEAIPTPPTRRTDAEVKEIKSRHAKLLALRKSRKTLFKDIFNTVTEQLPGKPKDIMETMGVELPDA